MNSEHWLLYVSPVGLLGPAICYNISAFIPHLVPVVVSNIAHMGCPNVQYEIMNSESI